MFNWLMLSITTALNGADTVALPVAVQPLLSVTVTV
jgi:hypothetical protein